MDPQMIGLIGLAVFGILLAVGVPVGMSMGLVGFAGFALIVSPTAALGKIALIPFATVIDYNFAVVPAFILMAQVFAVSGLATYFYDAAEKWLGHFRGGLGLATILACAVFATISASTVATVVTIGLVAIPEMLKRNYNPSLAGAAVAAGGGLGVLIPPSSILILYGLMTEQSIRELFLAGIFPGMLLAVSYAIVIFLLCKFNPSLAPEGKSYSFKEKMKALRSAADMFLLISLSIGGLSFGWFTPTEAGAVGAIGAILIALYRKRLTKAGFKKASLSTVANSGMVGLILVGALIFNYFAAVSTIPQNLVAWVGSIDTSPLIIMVLITLMYLVLGCFMDSLSMILLTVPFLFPVVTSLGYDPVWFGIYVILVMEMAVITPPVGMNVYATAGLVEGLSVETVFKGVAPFVAAQVINVIILLLFPQIALFLPSLLK